MTTEQAYDYLTSMTLAELLEWRGIFSVNLDDKLSCVHAETLGRLIHEDTVNEKCLIAVAEMIKIVKEKRLTTKQP